MGDKYISRYLSGKIRECVLSSGIFALRGKIRGVKTKHKFAQKSNRNCSNDNKKNQNGNVVLEKYHVQIN